MPVAIAFALEGDPSDFDTDAETLTFDINAAPAARVVRFGHSNCPLCPIMRQLLVETFRARTMIMGHFGQIAPTLTHDHENLLFAVMSTLR
jgi:hypothetical protein